MSTPILSKGTLVKWDVHKAPNPKCTPQQDAEIIHKVN